MLQNLLHPSFLTGKNSPGEPQLHVTSTDGFPDSGLLLVGRDWVRYESRTGTTFEGAAFARTVRESDRPPSLQAGTAVIDARVFNLVLARQREGRQRPPEFLEDLFESDPLGAGTLEPEERALLARFCGLETGSFGSPAWEPATLLKREIDPEAPERIQVFDGFLFNPGSVVRIEPEEGEPFDRVVIGTFPNRGLAELAGGLPAGLAPISSRVRPLRREPVDLNSAAPEVLQAIALGVRFRSPEPAPVATSRKEPPVTMDRWISPAKARAFAEAVASARPLEGPEDLWTRVLAPLVKAGRLAEVDAWALQLNGLDPNHGSLAGSTLAFAYRSGDRYLERINAAVRSRLGSTLARASRLQMVHAAPDGPLLGYWRTQREFEDLARWSRGAHGVTTMPHNLGDLESFWLPDGRAIPSPGLTLRVGAWEPTGLMLPSEEEGDSVVLPRPAREELPHGAGGMEHFDLEPSPLGYDAGKRGPLRTRLADWAGGRDSRVFASSVPLVLQGWFQVPRGAPDGVLLDLSGAFTDRQRVVAAFENGSLVVRAFGDGGDDPFDEDGLEQAVRVHVDPEDYPLEGRWIHLGLLLRDVSPRGIQLSVDGVPRGRVDGFTHLTQALPQYVAGDADPEIAVESTEGFPSRGALRIGDEVLEYSSKTDHSFVTARIESGSGFLGGRTAREGPDSLVNSLDSVHPEGAAVEIYGYNAILAADIPPGGGRLSGRVGTFSVARVTNTRQSINADFLVGGTSFTVPVGQGIHSGFLGPLELARPVWGDSGYAEAFQSGGGYALLFQVPTNLLDEQKHRIGGFEIIRYGAPQGDELPLLQRNVPVPASWSASSQQEYDGAPASFVARWADWTGLAGDPRMRLYVMPISLRGSDVGGLAYFPGSGDFSEFVQITPREDDGQTEWVRYDRILDDAFLRDDWGAIRRAASDAIAINRQEITNLPPGAGGGQGGGQGRGGPGGGLERHFPFQAADDWRLARTLGKPETDRGPQSILERVRRDLGFRGVMGTWDHPHAGGEDLVPVLRTRRGTRPSSGFAGRLDRVAVMQPGTGSAPVWFTVQWASPPRPDPDGRILGGVTYLAFRHSPGIPFLATPDVSAVDESFDVRRVARLVKFPCGERPPDLENLTLGGDATGAQPDFGGFLDEVGLQAAEGMGVPEGNLARGAFVLREDLSVSETRSFRLNPTLIQVDGQPIWLTGAGRLFDSSFLQLPKGGLLDMDGERIAFTAIDADGTVHLAPDGRGLHGTLPRGHASGTLVRIVDGRPASVLSAGISSGDAILPVAETERFPSRGLLLIDRELIHTSFRDLAGELAMPRRRSSSVDGFEAGEGLLRGRFGTSSADHPQGALVYSFPVRWEDRYVPQDDGPAGAWFGVSLREPGAYWKSLVFDSEVPDPAAQAVRVDVRSGAARWEDLPGTAPGRLQIEEKSGAPSGGYPLRILGDRLDLRITFDWGLGAFDAVDFLATGWTTAPRLRSLVVDYLAASRVERQRRIGE